MSDDLILLEIGSRIAQSRLNKNMTQKELAERAGISIRTLARMEAGEVSTQMESFIRVCRALGAVDRLNILFPESLPGPIEQLKLQGKKRKRASAHQKNITPAVKWEWGDDK
ncbi:MAG: helix-turn-helix domain-containing protein [Spirochaetota bacterium]